MTLLGLKKKKIRNITILLRIRSLLVIKIWHKLKILLVSEIILANKTAPDFMSCKDQNKALYTIRNQI